MRAAAPPPSAPHSASPPWSDPPSTRAPAVAAVGTWDETLADRVRVALSLGFGDLASGIGIRASRGVITLRGEVDELSDITRFESAVREVGDVADVDNLLRLRMRENHRPHVVSA